MTRNLGISRVKRCAGSVLSGKPDTAAQLCSGQLDTTQSSTKHLFCCISSIDGFVECKSVGVVGRWCFVVNNHTQSMKTSK